MALAPGTRIGPYDVGAQIGVGGMGEVYRASDTRLKRQVAIKVLPAAVATDPDRLARFQREAEVLAALNHPNIAAIYGLEDSPSATALVMELVEGPTLAERIGLGVVPVNETLSIARQITQALEAAHERGIIHRDLKPANIKIRPDGTVKVLDFGLAKAIDPVPDAANTSQAPTITTPALTRMGMILGTAAYMAPEQAKGRAADQRSDIWALGCIVYEMLTGRRAFEGEDVAETLARVLEREPDWSALPSGMSPTLGLYLRRCLHRDPKQRVADAQDLRLAFDGAFDAQPGSTSAPESATKFRRLLPPTAAFLAGASAVALLGLLSAPAVPSAPVKRFVTVLPHNQEFRFQGQPILALSPDGRSIAYNTTAGLVVRRLNELTSRVLPGTEDVLRNPIFSPDSASIAYFAARAGLKRISIDGGAAVDVGPASTPFGASWGTTGYIVYGQRNAIYRIVAEGGDPELLVSAADGESLYGPQLLPDGDSLLFTAAPAVSRGSRWDSGKIVMQSLSTGRRIVLIDGGSDGRYLATGHLVYAFENDLFGVRFAPETHTVTGRPVRLVQGVRRANADLSGAAHFTVASDGTLAYLTDEGTDLRRLVWVDRAGRVKDLPAESQDYRSPRISPDGRRVAVDIRSQADRNRDIWLLDVQSGAQTRLTTDPTTDTDPLWAPDGRRIAFASSRAGGVNSPSALFVMQADGTLPEALTSKPSGGQGPTSWLPGGNTLVFFDATGGYDLFTLQPGQKPAPVQVTPYREHGASFSPDGRWLAYSSEETGRANVVISPYPGPGGRITVSTQGGRAPRWSRDGRELFYRNGSQVIAVAITPGPSLTVGPPRILFEGNFVGESDGLGAHQYDVSADSRNFLMMMPANPALREAERRVVVVSNWFEELQRLVP